MCMCFEAVRDDIWEIYMHLGRIYRVAWGVMRFGLGREWFVRGRAMAGMLIKSREYQKSNPVVFKIK